MALIIVPGVYEGFWIKDEDKIVMWCFSKERAEERLKELQK